MGEQHRESSWVNGSLQEPHASDEHGCRSKEAVTPVASIAVESSLWCTVCRQTPRLVEEAKRLLTARTRLRRSSNFSSASRSFCTSSKRLISSAANFSGSTWISFGIRYVRWRKNTPGVSKRCMKNDTFILEALITGNASRPGGELREDRLADAEVQPRTGRAGSHELPGWHQLRTPPHVRERFSGARIQQAL